MTKTSKSQKPASIPDSLTEETEMLRKTIRKLYEQLLETSDLATAARAVQALSAAMGRLAQLTKAQEAGVEEKDEVEAAFWKAFNETIQELGILEQKR